MAHYYPIQVPFATKAERDEMKTMCREKFGRSFAEQVRAMLRKAQREQIANESIKAK